jgi:peptidoglycan/LPS O-acetylase OafA/YrhL
VRYNPALDGVRALAIALVILSHARLLGGGWIGVDVFFVLSGYLITSILLGELRRTGNIRLGNFYIRRALRLTPPMALFALFQFARAPFGHHPHEIVMSTLVAISYLENWNSVFRFVGSDAIGHTWSLATEEQFYWLWPLLLPLLFRSRPLCWLAGAAAVMVLARSIMWANDVSYDVMQGFLGDRPVGLLVGCGLAFLPKWKVGARAGLAAITAIGVLAFGAESCGPLFVLAPLAASLASAVLIVCLQFPGVLATALAWRPARYVGRISYGLYLYHLPVLIVTGATKPGAGFVHIGLAVALSFVLAALSHKFVEKPFLRLKDRFASPAAIVVPAGPDLATQS